METVIKAVNKIVLPLQIKVRVFSEVANCLITSIFLDICLTFVQHADARLRNQVSQGSRQIMDETKRYQPQSRPFQVTRLGVNSSIKEE